MQASQLSKPFNLSFQDRYILAFERDDLAFNSHLILETGVDVDQDKVEECFKKLIGLEPFTRIIPNFETGRFHSLINPDISRQIYFLKEEELEEFWKKKFSFPDELAIRLAFVGTKKIIFSFHHSVYDGHAQFNFLRDFFAVYTGSTYEPRTLDQIYKFNRYFRTSNPLWYFKIVLDLFKRKKKKPSIKIARLADREPTDRIVDIELLELDRLLIDKKARGLKMSSTAYLSYVGGRAMDVLLRERGNTDQPIVLYITKTMRPELKCPTAYQNLLGFVWMKLVRSDIASASFSEKFRDTYKFRTSDPEIRKTLFFSGLLVMFCSFKKLKKILKTKEKHVHDSTLLISSGRTPSDISFPSEWKISKLYARGSMHRSPGVALLVTSFGQKDFVAIEYLRSAFSIETIKSFREHILQEIYSE